MTEHRALSNPFSQMAVAQVSASYGDELTIETDPIRLAKSLLDAYLDAPADTEGVPGNVIAVLGEYGTGKTHLAMELLRYARSRPGYAHSMYLEAAASSFTSLYQRFLDRVTPADVRHRVNQLRYEVILGVLKGTELESVARRLIDETGLEPDDIADRLSVSKIAMGHLLEAKLRTIADNTQFITALALLAKRGYDTAVWSWLRGGEPDEILIERKITGAIDSEAMALEFMGYFAQLLYGGRQRRFLLVIDELDKVLSVANRPQEDIMGAFRTLLQVFDAAGAFLVLAGLPDFNLALRDDVRERIARRVFMSGLDADQVCRFIERSQRKANGTAQLAPFSANTVAFLVQLANGNPRTVIRLCHRLYAKWLADRASLTEEIVREEAREQLGLVSTDDISAEAGRLMDANNWSYLRQHFLGISTDTRVDYWVTFEENGPGCAVLITESVLDSRDVETLTRKALAVRAAAPDCRILLVVNGVLSDGLGTLLREVLDSEPLVYERLIFGNLLGALLMSFAGQLRQESPEPMSVLLERVEQIGRHQSSIYSFIEQVVTRLDDARSSADQRFGALTAQLDDLARTVHDGLVADMSTDADGLSVTLPGDVDELFTGVLDVLANLLRVDRFLRAQFESVANDVDTDTTELVPYFQRLLEPTAIAVVLQRTVLNFRDAAAGWYRSAVVEPRGDLSPAAAVSRLERLCSRYDQICEQVQLSRLQPLVAVIADGTTSADLSSTVYYLSTRVMRALVRTLPTT
jgi:Cdc6-like AAA superfamily ATPase